MVDKNTQKTLSPPFSSCPWTAYRRIAKKPTRNSFEKPGKPLVLSRSFAEKACPSVGMDAKRAKPQVQKRLHSHDANLEPPGEVRPRKALRRPKGKRGQTAKQPLFAADSARFCWVSGGFPERSQFVQAVSRFGAPEKIIPSRTSPLQIYGIPGNTELGRRRRRSNPSHKRQGKNYVSVLLEDSLCGFLTYPKENPLVWGCGI